ncbi:MAG: tyrosine-type recombinase/integrase [Alphaproteobacteria bacterium]|nr:tyrosine-type recombinase/integrase [Alphaproteobacteria bacterium]
MPLKLIMPGKRGNKCYYVRGQINGKRVEVSTGTANKADAERFKAELEISLLNHLTVPNRVTFAMAAESYLEWRKPSARDEKQIRSLVGLLGQRFVDEIVQDDLVQAAEILLPRAKPANMNRWIMRPAAAILHHAANNKWCEWQRIRLFKEPRPKTRATSPDVAKALIKGAPKLVQKIFLLWLFKHGERVTDAANIEWARIDFEAKTYRHYERKNDKWRTAPLDDEVLALLLQHKKTSKDKKTGELPRHVFPWRSRHSVYNWLIPLRDRVGVTFTPHMARHTVGTMLNAQGASLRTIMDRLGHTDVKSSLRYQAGDIEVVREAGKRLPRLS